jgi:DNA-binding NtrC family response regulator
MQSVAALLHSVPEISSVARIHPLGSAHPVEQALSTLRPGAAGSPDLVIGCCRAPGVSWFLELLDRIGREQLPMPVMAAIAGADAGMACAVLDRGAADFVTEPWEHSNVIPRVRRLLPHDGEEDAEIGRRLKETLGARSIVGKSTVFLKEIEKLPMIARCDACVLISGETGTGKEVSARAIHYLSHRANKPFITLNTAAIPPELIENELFGHHAGAFTGARERARGVVEEAHQGTLFLDEIDCLPLSAQPKLLRFLQEKEFRPLGSTQTRRVDVRVIAASNVDLLAAVEAGRFRKDLYFRLNVVPLRLAPLRSRQGDIPLLARHFLHKYTAEYRRAPMNFSPGAMQRLLRYDWPGNVRELENVIERAVVLAQRGVLGPDDLGLEPEAACPRLLSMKELKAEVVERFERSYITELLAQSRGNISIASRAAGKHRRAFWELMRKYDLRADVPVPQESMGRYAGDTRISVRPRAGSVTL